MAKIIGVLGLCAVAIYTAWLLCRDSKYRVDNIDQTNLREAGTAEVAV